MKNLEARLVTCRDCSKNWRYGCPECAERFAEYHRATHEGHCVHIANYYDMWWDPITRTITRRLRHTS